MPNLTDIQSQQLGQFIDVIVGRDAGWVLCVRDAEGYNSFVSNITSERLPEVLAYMAERSKLKRKNTRKMIIDPPSGN